MSVHTVADQPSIVDLHLHTDCSDGDDTADQVARRCVEAGLRVVACTDHDNMAGVAAFRSAVADSGLRVIPGCEITAQWHGREMHCLAYFVDPADPVFAARIGGIRAEEVRWWREWFEQAARHGAPVGWAAAAARFGTDRVAYLGDYLDFFLDAVAGDARFAGYPRGHHEELIRDWCRPGRPLHVARPRRPHLASVVDWVAEAGGVTVLAHPGQTLAPDEVSERLAELRSLGVTGIEVWTTWHRQADIDRLARLCAAYGLVGTQGSDYHGPRLKPWAPRPGLLPAAGPNPWGIVDALEAARPRMSESR